ncbi:MAG TPA: tetratricopeptide repeat protein [Xanthobacteraceae bacterium]
MKASIRPRMPLCAACAGALAGGVALFAFDGERMSEVARLAAANAAPAQAAPSAGSQRDWDFIVCHTPPAAYAATTRGMIRLAATPSEAPQAKANAASPALAFADSDPPVWDGLGSLSYKITTSSAAAQVYFDQGLRLTYAFNHEEAQRAFRKAQKLDPDCAMCFWGEALVLGPNINTPMAEEAVAPAFAAAQKAQALAAKASARERALVAALSVRYVADAKAERAKLDAAYAAAMAKAAAEFPDDDDIAVLYAESVMDLSPWNYWQPGGREPNPQSAPIAPTLERVLARNPDHPGASHYYIHAVEASDRPQRAEPYADRLRGAVPGAGHLVHMPSHIYYRVGRYLDALAVNKTAAAVDEKYLAASDAPMGVYRLGYYPHNVHFVMASALMSGDGPSGIAAAEKLRGLVPDQSARAVPGAQPVKAAPYFAHTLFSPPAAVLALPDPGDAIPYVKAMWHYARGAAFVAQLDFAAAAAEASAIETIERTMDFSLLTNAGIPALDVLKLARAVIAGRLALAQGDAQAAIEHFGQAAALQETLPYTEPPYWYYPVRQSLAVALMQAGRLDAAESEFRRALARAPNNGWSYYGLSRLYQARGDAEAARRAEDELAKTWVGDRGLLQLSKL